MKVGEKIRKIRELKGIKQEDIATALGITQTSYSKIERDETELSLSRLTDIAEKLEVKVEDILFWDPTAVFNHSTVHSYQNFGTFHHHSLPVEEKNLYQKLLAVQEQQITALMKQIEMLEEKIKGNNFSA